MKKLLNKKGFTLMEMMIVVAIIVILVAISIPTFSGSLDKANYATDAANLRAAKSAAVAYEMTNGSGSATDKYYDIEKGTIEDSTTTTGSCSHHKEANIIITAGCGAEWKATGATAIADAYKTKCE